MTQTHFTYLNIEGLYGNCQPLFTTTEQEKKELSGNDYLKLYGALAIMELHNKDLIDDYMGGMSLVDTASIQDSELYLNSFEGIWLNDRYCIKTMFLNKYDCIILSVFDNKFNRFINFVA